MKKKNNKSCPLDYIPEIAFRVGFLIILIMLIVTILMVSISEGAITPTRMGYSATDGTVYPKYYRPLRVDSLVMNVAGSKDTITGFGNGLTVNADIIEADTGVVATKNYVDDNAGSFDTTNFMRNVGDTVTGTYDFSGGYLEDINIVSTDTLTVGNTPESIWDITGYGLTVTVGGLRVDTATAVANSEPKPVTGNAVYDYIAAQGFLTTETGDISAVNTPSSSRLTGGATSGAVSLYLDTTGILCTNRTDTMGGALYIQNGISMLTGNIVMATTNTVDGIDVSTIPTTYAPILPDSTEIDSANIREWVSDKVGGMVTGNTETGIAVTYQDGDNTLDFAITLGTTIESSEITDQTIDNADVDSTSNNFAFDDVYQGTTAIADSLCATIRYARKVAGDSASAYGNPFGASIESSEILDGTIAEADLGFALNIDDITEDVVLENDAYVYGNVHEMNKIRRIPKTGTIYTPYATSSLGLLEYGTATPTDSEVVHPSWVYEPYGFGATAGDTFRYEASAEGIDTVAVTKKWSYFMAYTPLHAEDDDEDPCIVVSNDKIHWERPYYICTDNSGNGDFNGLVDDTVWTPAPLLPDTGVTLAVGAVDHFSDAFVTRTQEGYVIVYWRMNTTGGGGTHILNQTSPNGVFWRRDSTEAYPNVHDTETVYSNNGDIDNLVSPSVLLNDGLYEMYFVEPLLDGAAYDSTFIVRVTSDDYDGPFTDPDTCFINHRAGFLPWHAEIKNIYGQHVAMFTELVSGGESNATGNVLDLYCADSSSWVPAKDWVTLIQFPTASDSVGLGSPLGSYDSAFIILHPAVQLGADDTLLLAAGVCRRIPTEDGVTWNKYDGSNNWTTPGCRSSTSDYYYWDNLRNILMLTSDNTESTDRDTIKIVGNYNPDGGYETIFLYLASFDSTTIHAMERPKGDAPSLFTFFAADDATAGKDGPKLLLWGKDSGEPPAADSLSISGSATDICNDASINNRDATTNFGTDTVLYVGREKDGAFVPVFDYYGEVLAPDSLNTSAIAKINIYKSSFLPFFGMDGNMYLELMYSAQNTAADWSISNTQVHFLTERDYIDLDQVYGRRGGYANATLWPNMFDSGKGFTCIDSGVATSTDTVWFVKATEKLCVIDTIETIYRVSNGTEITARYLYGPDYSDGFLLADSLYDSNTDDLTSETFASAKWGVDNVKRKYGIYYPAGGQITLRQINAVDATDKVWTRVNRAWIWRKP